MSKSCMASNMSGENISSQRKGKIPNKLLALFDRMNLSKQNICSKSAISVPLYLRPPNKHCIWNKVYLFQITHAPRICLYWLCLLGIDLSKQTMEEILLKNLFSTNCWNLTKSLTPKNWTIFSHLLEFSIIVRLNRFKKFPWE